MSVLSLRKLKKAQQAVNDDSHFRHLGNVDVKMGVKVGKPTFLVSFEGFTCHSVEKIAANELRESDFLIEMDSDQWSRYIKGCQSGSGGNLAQFDASEYVVKADPRMKLDFLRYHTSIQAFFEAYAQLDTSPA